MTEQTFVHPDDFPQVEMLPGVHRRTMSITPRMMLCEIFLTRDSVVPRHSHHHDQVGYVVFGRLEMTIADEMRVLVQGDSYAIPGGIEHGARAQIDTIVIDVFTPPREEYRNP